MDNGQFNTTEATLPTAVDERLWQRSSIHIALYVTKRPTGCRKSLQEAQRSRGACLLGNLHCFRGVRDIGHCIQGPGTRRTHQQLSTLNKSCVVDSYQ
ncbi:unnamed protein product [Fusarium graminearum]|nr:unnamed protein product [Fusarium graminearum]